MTGKRYASCTKCGLVWNISTKAPWKPYICPECEAWARSGGKKRGKSKGKSKSFAADVPSSKKYDGSQRIRPWPGD